MQQVHRLYGTVKTNIHDVPHINVCSVKWFLGAVANFALHTSSRHFPYRLCVSAINLNMSIYNPNAN